MSLFDFLAQASFWQWIGFLHMCWILCFAINGIGPLINYVRNNENKKP